MKLNIYNYLIDHNEMKKLAVDIFQRLDLVQKGFVDFDQITQFVKKFLLKIEASSLFSNEQIETIYKECLITGKQSMNIDDFIVFLQIFLELLYELYDHKEQKHSESN